MIKERAENVLVAYVGALFQNADDPLFGLRIYPGHGADEISESGAGGAYAIVECEEQGGPLASVGIPTLRVRWILRAPLALENAKAQLETWSQEIINIFSLLELDDICNWINTTQTAENIGLNALRYVTSGSGRVKDREQLGAEIVFDGEFFVPAAD